jgi:hypothetical protein
MEQINQPMEFPESLTLEVSQEILRSSAVKTVITGDFRCNCVLAEAAKNFFESPPFKALDICEIQHSNDTLFTWSRRKGKNEQCSVLGLRDRPQSYFSKEARRVTDAFDSWLHAFGANLMYSVLYSSEDEAKKLVDSRLYAIEHLIGVRVNYSLLKIGV